MRHADLNRRESADEIAARSLEIGWEIQGNEPFKVSLVKNEGQQWLLQPLLSFYLTGDASREVRGFMADTFRITKDPIRLVPQYVLGTLLTTPLGLQATSQSAFWVTPPVAGAGDRAIYTGNQRLLQFDLATRRVRVMLKHGFGPAGMLTEIEIRKTGNTGPFACIDKWDDSGAWFEEPLIQGFSLARCPPWRSRAGYTERALAALASWLERHQKSQTSDGDLEQLIKDIERLAADCDARYGCTLLSRMAPWLPPLCAGARKAADKRQARTHGDFQPGNILVDPGQDRILFIDWEHSAIRYWCYDFLVFGLRSRSPRGIGWRLARFLRDGEISDVSAFLPELRALEWRNGACCWFLLEELRWYLRESLMGPFRQESATLRTLLEELEQHREELGRLIA